MKNEFEILMQNREKDLYRIAYSYMKNESDALDCVNDSIIKAMESFNCLKSKNYFDTWVIRILINTCKDKLKKKKDVVFLDDEIDKITEKTEDKDSLIDLFDSLDALSDEEKEIIYLRYFEGKKLREISFEKNMKLGTLKSKLSRTILKLREKMC